MGRAEVYLRRQTVTKNIHNIRKILLVFQDASFLEKVLTIEDLKKIFRVQLGYDVFSICFFSNQRSQNVLCNTSWYGQFLPFYMGIAI